jgi:hypothetical protein
MSADFNTMLNDHLTYELLNERLEKKNYLWKTLEHDDEVSGDIIVPFSSSRASSVKAGAGPSAIDDIAKHGYVRGSIAFDDIPKTWGSLLFNYEDILNHEGRVKQKSFLGKFLPEQVEDFTDFMAETLSHSVLNRAWKDTAAGTGATGGTIAVYHPERFEVGEKIILDPVGANASGYITAIDMNTSSSTGTLTVKNARSSGSAVDLSGVAAAEKIYKEGFQTAANQMTSLADALLTSGNGGDTNIYGQAKTASKFTQAINISGADITANNILTKLFDAHVVYKQKAKVGASECWMSFKHLGSIMKVLEQDKGPYKTVPGSLKSNEYGFTEITVYGPGSSGLKIVALQEMNDDLIFFVDPSSMKWHSVKGINKVKSPDGNMYTVNRSATTGFDFVVDLYFRGDLIVSKPHRNAVVCAISY